MASSDVYNSFMLAALIASALLAPPFTVDEKIVYRTVDKQKLMLDLYRPAMSTGKVPLVIVIHGGSWMSGTRADMDVLCEQLAQHGLAAATVDYRLAPKSKWPSMLDDCEMAYAFLLKKAPSYQLDANRIGVTGASAGGHLALLMAEKPVSALDIKAGVPAVLKIRAVLNLFGPTDLSHDFDPSLSNMISMQVLGKPASESTDDAIQMSPLTFVKAGSPPVFTIHGEADTLVPIKQAERLNDALSTAQVDHVFRRIPGMGHEYAVKNPAFLLALGEGIDFLTQKLTAN